MIDTHAHLNFYHFQNDIDEVIEKSFAKGLEDIILVGTNVETSKIAVEMAEKNEKLFATVGVHPQEIDEAKEFPKIEALANNKNVVAIGETGLDYYRLGENLEEGKRAQKELLLSHIKLAKDRDLPLIFHNRDSHEDFYQIVKDKDVRGVIHCYTGNVDFAKKILDLGFMISFTGIITFDRGENLIEVIKKVPLEKIMVETDAPYLSPVPYRGKRCEPWMVKEVIQKIADIKELTFREVEEKTSSNAKVFFGI
ncbi:MAG: TatD family hydrolase [bacterium]|nr:TatD family hydrolase [bacterium]